MESLEQRVLLAGEAVTHFILVNAQTDQLIGELVDGAVINFEALGTNKLNVIAETAGDTRSVRFGLDSKANFRTENSVPFTLAGDANGDYKPWTPSLGTHTLKGTPFSGSDATGTVGTALQISFLVVDEPVGDPVELQASASSISFGDVIAGSFQEVMLTLWNPEEPGGASLTLQSTGISGSSVFSDDYSDAPLILGPGQDTTLKVRFAPTGEGSFSGSLNILHSGINNPLSIALSGSGVVSNHAPVLAPVGNKTIAPGAFLSITISATDADGDVLALSAAGLPSWAAFTDHGGGSGTLLLSPPAGVSGTFSGLTITATDDGDPVMSDSETISVTVSDNSVIVHSLTLYNADTDQPIGTLVDGAVINYQAIGTKKINVQAEASSSTESVRFALDSNSNFRTENSAPYTLAGDSNGDYKAWTPSIGTHTIRATPYSGDNASGTAGVFVQITFQVIDEPVGDDVELTASVTSIDFGDVLVGGFVEATVTLSNLEPPEGLSVTVQGTDLFGSFAFSDDFNDSAGVTLAPGQSTLVKVRFTPTLEGPVSGTLSVRHTGTNNPLSIALSGRGTVSNHAPVLGSIGNRTLDPGTTLNIAVSATDADGDQITLSAANLPAWASFTDHGGGSGTLVLSPPVGTTGSFSELQITATDDGDPVMSDSESFSVTVADNSVVVYSLTLINADTDQPVGTLVNGGQINFALAGSNKLNIRADTSAGTVSVRFGYDSNNNFRTENSKPFAFAGDTNGDYKAWTPTLGAHVLSATPFSGSSASGTAGPKLTINVTVVEGAYLVASPANPSFSVAQGGTIGGGSITLSAEDGAPGVAYTATSNSLWLTLGAGSGTTADHPLVVGVNTSGLAIGTHVGYITVTSPTHGGVRIPVTLNVTGAFIADQVHLSFVQDPSTTLSVVWRTMNAGTQPLVEYRALGEGTWLSTSGAIRSSGTSGQLFETLLSGLSPATTYEYRVRGDGGTWSQIYTTRTMPAMGPADFSAIYFADTGLIGRTDGLDTGTAQAIAEIQRLAPDLLLAGGDYAYFNTDGRFGTLENTIDAWFNQNQPIFSSIPVMPTYGNHEVLLGEGYSQWAARFATPDGWNDRQNYSFDVGDAHFVSIMAVSDTAALSTSSFNWLVSDLAAAQAAGRKWIIPFFHVSPFSDGKSHPSNLALRAQLGPVFEQYGVKVALMSHDQNFERTYPLAGVADNITRTSTALTGYGEGDGVTWLKVSPAGKLSNKSGVDNFSKFQTHPAPFWTAVRDDTMHHFSRLIFSADGTLRVETYGFHGDGSPVILMDSFEYALGAAAMGGGEDGGGGDGDSDQSGGGFWSGGGSLTGLFDGEKKPSGDEEPDLLAGEEDSELL